MDVLIKIVAAISIVLFILWPVTGRTRKAYRHKRNIKESYRLRQRYLSFDSKNRNARIIAELKRLDPYVFEELVLTSLENLGFRIKRSPAYSGDGGEDGRVYIDKTLWLVQSKCYTDGIKAAHVKEFSRLVGKQQSKGFFVHTGKTGDKARQQKSPEVKIISGTLLAKLILGTLNTFELTGSKL